MKPNQFEIEFNRLLKEENPGFYNELNAFISDYEKELIANRILLDGSYKSYVQLLSQIAKEERANFVLSPYLNDTLKKLGEGVGKIMFPVEGVLIAKGISNAIFSKGHVFTSKILAMVNEGISVDKSILAKTFLEVYDEEDLKLPLVKLKIFGFLDSKKDHIIYTYIGPSHKKE